MSQVNVGADFPPGSARSAWAVLCGALAGLSFLLLPELAYSQTLASLPSHTPTIDKGATAKPLLGWIAFCQQFGAECAVDRGEPVEITLTSAAWNTIVSVNKAVNNKVEPITDKDHWNEVDAWGFPDDGKGDCEDYQLLKRRMLVEKGFPRRALRMTVVIDELGEGHAVLMARTNRGDFILDNKTMSVLPWDQTGYVFVKRESQDEAGWVSLGGRVAAPTTTANR